MAAALAASKSEAKKKVAKDKAVTPEEEEGEEKQCWLPQPRRPARRSRGPNTPHARRWG